MRTAIAGELERLRRQANEALTYFVNYCHHAGLAAKAYLSFGTDPIEEVTKLADKIYQEFPHSIFFTSKLIFEHDNWYIRQLHSEAALTMLPAASTKHADGDPADEIVREFPRGHQARRAERR